MRLHIVVIKCLHRRGYLAFATNLQKGAKELDGDCIVSLSNKYFDAKVRFSDIGYTIIQTESSVTVVEDGIILTFQDSKTNASIMRESFDALDSQHSLAQSIQQCGDVIRLCVGIYDAGCIGTNPMEEALLEEEYQRRVLWCLDRGYEYIEADMSEEGMQKGHEDREKDGYARILEAFQSTIWSSAVKVETAEGETPTEKSVSEDQNALELNELEAIQIPHTEETYFENLDHVMREAIRIRDDARSGTLSDEERRKRAGDAAMALMGLLEQMGFDEDEDDE